MTKRKYVLSPEGKESRKMKWKEIVAKRKESKLIQDRHSPISSVKEALKSE